MSSNVYTWRDSFGFYNEEEREAKGVSSSVNRASVLGYLPIIGTIIGIVRIGMAIDGLWCLSDSIRKCKIKDPNFISSIQTSSIKTLHYSQIARGVLELLFLGLFCLVLDLTVKRRQWQKQPVA